MTTTQEHIAITSAEHLKARENYQTYVKFFKKQDLLALDNPCPTSVRELTEIIEICLDGRKHAV